MMTVKKPMGMAIVAIGSILLLANTCYVEPPQGNKNASVPYVAQIGSLTFEQI